MIQTTRSFLWFLLASTLSVPAFAQRLPGVAALPPVAPESTVVATLVDSASPRAALRDFLAAIRANDLPRAVAFLDLADPAAKARGAELARRLAVVLEIQLQLDLDDVSPFATGHVADGLPLDRELIGEVIASDGRQVPIRLAQQGGTGRGRWVFSVTSVAQIDAMFSALPDHWVREHLPGALRRSGPFNVQWWQWLALFTLIPLAAIVGFVLARPAQSVLKRLVRTTETEFDDALVDSARGPIVLLIGVLTSRVLLRWIALPGPTERFVVELQTAIALVAVFWILLRLIGVLQQALARTEWGSSHAALRSLIPLGGRVARLLVLIVGLLTVVASFGYPIATILAGLGLGGIAIALGAQKSLEHFFGSVSIGIDQPFRVGDWVIADGVEGEVEAIGLRSTRLRTLERTVVSIPNGRLAETRSENFGQRDRIRLRTTIGLEYGTTATTVECVRDGIDTMLRGAATTWPERVVVRFSAFSPSSIDFEIFCWVMTTDPDEFRRIREAHYLGMMRIVEEAGARFAYPTQTVFVRGVEGSA